MMDKEKIIEDFFKSLKVALNNTSIYFKEHPLFLRSVKDLKQKIDILFGFLSIFRIGVTPRSLLVDGKYWEKARIYEDLANIFHHRQIKNIEIKKGISIDELVFFLTQMSMSAKDILKRGGLSGILNKGGITHVLVEDLDYSQLLGEEGEEFKDLWAYILAQAVQKADYQEINDFVDNFGSAVSKFRQKDFLENDTLRTNIAGLFTYLKDKDKPKFLNCAKELIKTILKDKSASSKEQIDKLRIFFKDLSNEDFVDTLFEEISTDDNFDSLSFHLFSQLMDEEKQQRVADSLANRNILSVNPRIRKKIRELLSGSTDNFISQVYRHTLSSLLKDIHFEDEVFLGQKILFNNYISTLINLLAMEKDKKKITLILERIIKDRDKIINNVDIEYLKNLSMIIEKKKAEDITLVSVFLEWEIYIGEFMEREVLDGKEVPDVILNFLKRSYSTRDFYLDKIFRENRITHSILYLLFKFFSGDLAVFYSKLKQRSDDIDFLKYIVESLRTVRSVFSLITLKQIYNFSKNFVKMEVLRAMSDLFKLSIYDEKFLFSVLREGNIFFKRLSLAMLINKDNTKDKAVRMLFSVYGVWFGRNRILEENITLAGEFQLKEAEKYLNSWSKNKFFWNKRVRNSALTVLKNWQNTVE